MAQLGGLDILVNNAGIAYIGDIESFTMEQFDRLVAINVKGVFVAIQRAVPTSARVAASSTSAASTPIGCRVRDCRSTP